MIGTVREMTQNGGYDLTLRVDEYLKGRGRGELVIHSASLFGPSCSPFGAAPVGQSYLLFLHTDSRERLSTNICEGSRVITDGPSGQTEPDIEEIRRIVAGEPEATPTAATPGPTVSAGPEATALPSAGGGGTTSSGASPWAVAGASAAGLVALAGFLFIAWRGVRRRSDAG